MRLHKWMGVIGQIASAGMWCALWMWTGWEWVLIPFAIHVGLGLLIVLSPSPTAFEDRQDVQRVDGRTPDGRSQESDRGSGQGSNQE